jgi:hypothetical protein
MKKFTSTDKWDDPWHDALSQTHALVWSFVNDRCDHAGVFDISERLIAVHVKDPRFSLTEFAAVAGPDRFRQLPCGKWWLPKYIAFQHGRLSRQKNQHRPVFRSIEKHALPVDEFGCMRECVTLNGQDSCRIAIGQLSDSCKVQDTDKDKEEKGGVGEKTWRPDPRQIEPVTDELPREGYGPPTRREVIAYCERQGWPTQSGEAFWLFYDAKEWSTFSARRWHSRLESWILRDAAEGKVKMNGRKPNSAHIPPEPAGWRDHPEFAGVPYRLRPWPEISVRDRNYVIQFCANGHEANTAIARG